MFCGVPIARDERQKVQSHKHTEFKRAITLPTIFSAKDKWH